MKSNTLKGTVIKTTGSWYSVKVDNIDQAFLCRIRGNFRIQGIKTTNPIAVGDVVEFHLLAEENVGLITAIQDRKNYIIRKSTNLSKRTHILAANIDQAVLVASLAFPRTSTGFIDRFLVNAESYHIDTVLVFNKIDLYDEELWEHNNQIKTIYEKAGYTCLNVSALKGTNCDSLRELMKGKTSLFAGHSGVGKSALANALDNLLHLRTGEISNWSSKGTHTTTFAEIFPLSFGGNLIDTPGIKEFGMVNIEKQEISHFYPEMREVLHHCKFANCTHEHEPGCAVKQAVEKGVISELRYKNYLNILNGKEMDIEDWQK